MTPDNLRDIVALIIFAVYIYLQGRQHKSDIVFLGAKLDLKTRGDSEDQGSKAIETIQQQYIFVNQRLTEYEDRDRENIAQMATLKEKAQTAESQLTERRAFEVKIVEQNQAAQIQLDTQAREHERFITQLNEMSQSKGAVQDRLEASQAESKEAFAALNKANSLLMDCERNTEALREENVDLRKQIAVCAKEIESLKAQIALNSVEQHEIVNELFAQRAAEATRSLRLKFVLQQASKLWTDEQLGLLSVLSEAQHFSMSEVMNGITDAPDVVTDLQGKLEDATKEAIAARNTSHEIGRLLTEERRKTASLTGVVASDTLPIPELALGQDAAKAKAQLVDLKEYDTKPIDGLAQAQAKLKERELKKRKVDGGL